MPRCVLKIAQVVFVLLVLINSPAATAQVSRGFSKCDGGYFTLFSEVLWAPLPSLITKNFSPKKTMVLFYSSDGGNIELVQERANSFRDLATRLNQSGGQLIVVINGVCASACTMVLANLNSMAASGLLKLYVKDDAKIGFHGAHGAITKAINEDGTKLVIETLIENGVSPDWLQNKKAMFETVTMTYFPSTDRDLQSSGIISAAQLSSHEELKQLLPIQNCQ